jgi:hypothetical protein
VVVPANFWSASVPALPAILLVSADRTVISEPVGRITATPVTGLV